VSISVRLALAGDERRIALVGQATFLETFAGLLDRDDILAHCEREHAASVYADWLAKPSARIWLVETEVGGAPVGYLLLSKASLPLTDLRGDDLEVKRIYLLHRFHGSGIGQTLLDRAIEEASRQGASRLLLGVFAGNERAMAFYARNGFVKVGDRRLQVGANSYDDVMLALDLASSQA
jgi:diamine N-acetyltransferase